MDANTENGDLAKGDDIPRLELKTAIGFNGKVPNGLLVHPKRQHLVYPLGLTVVVEELGASRKQTFLAGHTNDITCITVSKSGKYIASGQVTYMGFKADIIVWNFDTLELYSRLTLHKVKIEQLEFSANDLYLFSLGGQDDGNVVVWDLERKEPICGSPAQVESAGTTLCLKSFYNSDEHFVTAGEFTLRVWVLDRPNRKIFPTSVDVGKLKRVIKCIDIASDDSFCFCGTTSGDIMAVNLRTFLFQVLGPAKERFSLGVTALILLKTDELLIGTGAGEVAVVKGMKSKFARTKGKHQKVDGPVSSIALRGQGHQFYVGDSKSHIYRFNFNEFTYELCNSCHFSPVNDVAFAHGTSELFATCSYQDIRIWHLKTSKELLRITVPNMTCNAVDFMRDGRSILSGWDDGKIRAFYPESGKSMYVINDAHLKGVTALTTTSDSSRIISGGGEGQVRVWEIKPGMTAKGMTHTSSMIQAMKEHKGSVSCIRIRRNDSECVSSSTDGTCIIWDLQRFVRNQIIFANTLFKCVAYRPDESQVITSGTDRKLGYWETFDGSLIRELEGSKSGSINGLDIDSEGNFIVTGGDDRLVKVWKYNEGEVIYVGFGHSGSISRVRICPHSKYIVSVSHDGAILCWNFPLMTTGATSIPIEPAAAGDM